MQQRASFTHPIWTPSCCFILDKLPCKLCHNPKFRSKLLIITTKWNSWGSNKGNFIEVAHTRLLWRSRSWLSPVLSPPKHQNVVSFDGIHLNLLKIWDNPIVAYTGHSYNTMCINWWRYWSTHSLKSRKYHLCWTRVSQSLTSSIVSIFYLLSH